MRALPICLLAFSLLGVPQADASSSAEERNFPENGSFQQSTAAGNSSAETQAQGRRIKIKGVVTRRDADTFTVRDTSGVDVIVRLADQTSVKERKSNPFRRARTYPVTSIMRGLNLEVEGREYATDQLTAEKIRFSDADLKLAKSIETRVTPVETRVEVTEKKVDQTEEAMQRLSGELDELAAVANLARGGAKAAQDAADRALAGVTATNARISALDDYVSQQAAMVNFGFGRDELTPEARIVLDDLAKKIQPIKGYVVEVTGFADAIGSDEHNQELSERRAETVVRYLVENNNIPLRRIVVPFGYGEARAVSENNTREGRARNRRVEVKVLVNRGLTQTEPTVSNTTTP